MMFKSLIPFAHATSIYDVDPAFFVKQGVKTLFLDLDNTLDSYKSFHPNDRSIELIEKLRNSGITPIIISNNKGKRVSSYANDLKIEYVNSARKPFPGKIKKEIAKRNLKNNEVMLVGDQLLTDVLAGKGAKIRVLLTEKLVKEDQWTTHINRLFDKPIRKYHKKHGNLKDWRAL